LLLSSDLSCDLLGRMTVRPRIVGAATDELLAIDLGDARLDARVRRLVAALERNPAAGFPAAVGTEAEREAVYRLLGNGRVTLEALLAPHAQQTVRRAEGCASRPLVVIDKTAFVFAGESDRDGLTRLGAARQGFDAFVALAVSAARAPWGVLAIQPLDGNAGRSSADGWAGAVTAAEASIGALQPIYVMDREADGYPLFAQLIERDRDFVVRVSHERLVKEHAEAGKELLRAIVARAPVRLRRTVRLARRITRGKPRDARRRYPPREGREASLAIRACAIVLPRPPKLGRACPDTLAVNLVQVVEDHPPADVTPVEWLLVTTLPVTDARAVGQIVDSYRARWTIEEYFKALKSGCAYEKRQLESRATLLNALGVLAPLAWRLLALRTAAADVTAPATAVLEDDELHVLRHLSRDVRLGPTPTVAEALCAIARIGGHFPQNGRPGWKVLWTGFQKLIGQVEGYRLARAELASPPNGPTALTRKVRLGKPVRRQQ
jgi:hypothetical protein